MRLKVLLTASAALAAIAIAVPATIAPFWSPIATAQAATSISFSLFYDGLDDHGDWISKDGDYVFVPAIDDRDWQPYTKGHWVYAREYGWTWASDEPFGWATYHYGRWGFDDQIGWYWVPGSRWAPAWVSWRRSGDHVAWAPLPPRRGGGDEVSITVEVNTIPDYYWVAVPSRRFLEINLDVVIIDDVRERRRIVETAEFVGSVQIENNIVVNNVININYIEENTGTKVTEVEVKQTDDPAKAKATESQVEVYNGTIEPDQTAKPTKVKEVTEVTNNQDETKKKIKAETTNPAAGTTSDDQATQPAEQPVDQDAATDADKVEPPATPKDKKEKKELKADDEGTTAEPEKVDPAVTPKQEKKKELVEESPTPAPIDEAAEPEVQPDQKKTTKNKSKNAEPVVDEENQPVSEEPPVVKDKETKDKKVKKDKDGNIDAAVPCNPEAEMSTQEGCVPQ